MSRRTDNRITVNLTDQADVARQEMMARNGRTITEVVSAALIRANFFEAQIEAGKGILVEDGNGELERIHLL
jgi:hypothetical protein